MQSWIFSIITYDMILQKKIVIWLNASQEIFIIIINVEIVCGA